MTALVTNTEDLDVTRRRTVEPDSVALAYVAMVRDVVTSGESVPASRDPASVGSGFGAGRPGSRELRSWMAQFVTPTPAFPTSAARPTDLAYAAGLLMWMLAGSDDLEWIAYYNDRGRAFSADGSRLPGAPGPRLISGPQNLHILIETLRRDPSSRRAAVSIMAGGDPRDSDFACQSAFQWLIREGSLSAVTTMRSQSALLVLPYDLFIAAALHGIMASEVGLPMGRHDYFAASLHVYDDEFSAAERLLDEGAKQVNFLPVCGGFNLLPGTLRFEERVRNASATRDAQLLRAHCADELQKPTDFWSQIKVVLAVHALRRMHLEVEACEVAELLAPDLIAALRLREHPADVV